jgi:hypothetical protein
MPFIYFYVVDLVIVIGIVILAPLSKPLTVNVLNNVELDPNNVFTVVALNVNCVPTIVDDTLVPIVCVAVALALAADVVLIPVPSNVFNNLISAIVAE